MITSFTLDMAEVCAGSGSCAAPVNGTEDTTYTAAKSRVSSQHDPIIILMIMLWSFLQECTSSEYASSESICRQCF